MLVMLLSQANTLVYYTVKVNSQYRDKGTVIGEVHAQTAHVSGTFKGFLEAQQYVIFTDGSKFEGTLDTPSMVCSLGTTLVGDVRVKPHRQ